MGDELKSAACRGGSHLSAVCLPVLRLCTSVHFSASVLVVRPRRLLCSAAGAQLQAKAHSPPEAEGRPPPKDKLGDVQRRATFSLHLSIVRSGARASLRLELGFEPRV